MNELKLDEIIEILPQYTRKIPHSNKFLFFFPPCDEEEKFLFGLSLKTGVQIYAIITLTQAIGSLYDIFSPETFSVFLVDIFAIFIFFIISFYAFEATLKENYSYANTSYLISSIFFLLAVLEYLCKSVIKAIEFIIPWDGDFLRLTFLAYVIGRGLYLFIYLYFIYILFH